MSSPFSIFRAERKSGFEMEHTIASQTDILDKALYQALYNYQRGVTDASTYFKTKDRVKSLKKLRFTENYCKFHDEITFQWMKHKVAAEIGGAEYVYM